MMEKYDIILEAGQSNAAGYGHGPATKPYIPDNRVLYLTAGDPQSGEYEPKGNYEIQIATERVNPNFGLDDRLGDLSLSFGQKYVESGLLAQDRKLLIIRAAVGGTGFLKHYWAIGDPLFQRMLRMTDYGLSLHPENKFVGFLWHQGEHEAAFHNDPQHYHQQLLEVIESVRARYQIPDLPFICGGFCNEWVRENQPYCDQIMAVIKSVADKVGGRYVETSDLRSNNQRTGDKDTIHFCREDLYELGHRYFNAFLALKSNTI